MRTLSLICALIFVFGLKIYAQNLSPLQVSIANQLYQKYDKEYLVLFALPLDNIQSSEATILSAYDNTINDKVLFIATPPYNQRQRSTLGIFGIYQNNILWDSEPVINPYSLSGYNLNAIGDINKDGEIEIIISWFRGNQLQTEELWIFSWDGDKGQIISNILIDSTSALVFKSGSIKYVDTNLDGVLEVLGKNESGEEILYNWNDSEYIIYDNGSPLLPRDGIKINIHSTVEVANGVYKYKYKLKNDSISLQSVEDFYLKKHSNSFFNEEKPAKWSFSSSVDYNLIRWHVDPILKYNFNALIEPGSIEKTFSFHSIDLPRVVTFYSQGNNGELSFNTEYLFENSFSGLTLGPWLPDSSLSLEAFTDTLKTFRFRSCTELDWATDVTVCEELEDNLSAVKSNLQAGDSLSAANALSDFIELVEQEKDKSLTSEGYALLYFNAEYLAERLPEPRIKR